MSSALRRKKKRSKWGADLEAEPIDSGLNIEGAALDAARIPADTDAAGPDPLSSNWRTANSHSDAPLDALQSQKRGSLPAEWTPADGHPEAVTAGAQKHDTGMLSSTPGSARAGSLDKDRNISWGIADANGESEAVKQPKQGFSLNFVRPASKSKAAPASLPPPSATPAQEASVPTSGVPANSQQGHLGTEARAETSEELQPVEATLLLSPEDKVREEENRPEDLSAQPTSAPDKSSNAVPIEAEATAETQQQIDVRGVESASALTDVKTDHQSLASEEEGPPGDDGPPGEAPEENDEPAAKIGDGAAAAATQTGRISDGAKQEAATTDGTASEPGLMSQGSRGLAKEPCSLVVSNIRPTANEQSLRLLFESAGQVLGCKLVKDEGTAAHKGFGFVMMASVAEAESAARKFSNFEWGDLQLQVTVKLPAKAASPSPATATAAVPPPWGTPNGPLPGPPSGVSQAFSPAPGAEISLPGPPKEQDGASAEAAPGLSSLPQESLPPAAPPGMPDSLPIASAYGAYPPYDPYAGYYGYGYGYADPYAAYGAPAYNLPNGSMQPMPSSEIERPPGMEDDELPPGEDAAPAHSSPYYHESLAHDGPGEVAGAEPSGEAQEVAQEALAPPPPPVAPKKEPTVIHVPLKIPEGARKKQEERKKAREEKAKQLAEDGKSEEAINGDVGEDGKESTAAVKAVPAVVGTKGSFQEVLARRQAELAALKNKNASGPSGAAASRPFKRGRSMSRSPPPVHRRSRSARSPYRASPRRPYIRSPSRSYSRSPARSYTPSPSRSRSPLDSRRDISYSRSPSRYSFSGSDGRPSLSPGLVKKKDKAKKKEKKKKEKKEKKQKSRTREAALAQPLPDEPAGVRDSYLLPPKPLDDKPAPGWVALDARESKRQIRLPSPPVVEEPRRPAEPAVFRPPPRKKPRTRWHEDAEGGWPNGEQTVAEYEPKPATPRGRREEGQIAERQREVHAKPSRAESTQVAEKRKPSPQVSEEGEIALEEGEIEGELLVVESEAPPAEPEPRQNRQVGYEEYRHDERHRGWNQPRFPGGRGRGRGGRGSYGYGHDNRYAEPRPW